MGKTQSRKKPGIWSIFLVLAFGAGIWYFNELVLYVLLAVILSYILKPLVNLFEKLKIKGKSIPRGLTAAMAFLTLFLALFGFFTLLIPVVGTQINNLSGIKPDDVASTLEEPILAAEAYLIENGLTKKGYGFLEEDITASLKTLLDFSQLKGIFQLFGSAAGSFMITIFSVLFIGFFLLRDDQLLKNFFITVLPKRFHTAVERSFLRVDELLTRYFIGLLMQVTIVATLVSTGMYLLKVDNALLIGVFAGLINLIPYLGPLLAASFGLFLGITANLNMDFTTQLLPLLIKMTLVFSAVQLLDNFVLQPLIFSRSVYAHPIEIYLVVLVGAQLVGPLGMFLAIPIYTILRVSITESRATMMELNTTDN